MLHICVQKFDVTKNLKKFYKILGTLKHTPATAYCMHASDETFSDPPRNACGKYSMYGTVFFFKIGVNQNGQDLHSLHLETDELHMLCMTQMPYVQFRAAQFASNKGHWHRNIIRPSSPSK